MVAGHSLKKDLHLQKPQQSLVALGAVLGGLAGSQRGRDSLEMLANIVVGALAGMVLGSILQCLDRGLV